MSEEREHDEELGDAGAVESAEAMEAAEEILHMEEYGEEDPAAVAEALLAEAHDDARRARASWHLVQPELMVMLFCNCLFFAGALAAWDTEVPDVANPALFANGLDSVRGALIFGLSLFGFWIMAINIWFRQLIVWPFLLNAIFGLWVGIPGFTGTIGSEKWERANAYIDTLKKTESVSLLQEYGMPLSMVPPGAWLLTIGGVLVLIVLLKGILGGAKSARTTGAGDGGRRRRR